MAAELASERAARLAAIDAMDPREYRAGVARSHLSTLRCMQADGRHFGVEAAIAEQERIIAEWETPTPTPMNPNQLKRAMNTVCRASMKR